MEDSIYNSYEAVIGLEVHAQLLTNSKMFSADDASYGGAPNSHVDPISLGHPGTLPVVNERAIEYAVRLGLACNCEIREHNEFARKNYFYADLPKGYQISQDTTPICFNGHVEVDLDGETKRIGITRIHMEEDSGKSIHDLDPFHTLIDLNRAGVPLLEIVSEPDMRTPEEAYAYLQEIRKLVRYLEICDGNMEEGSLRCDANISIRKKGEEAFGTKVEVKNINSIRNVQRALEFEFKRQVMDVENGIKIIQETKNFDAATGTTIVMRSKEDAHDYRYFPEPDLSPVSVTDKYISEIEATQPSLPRELLQKYTSELGLSDYDAQVLTESKEIAQFFEDLTVHTDAYKAAANWVMGPVKSYLNENALHINQFKVRPHAIASLIQMIDKGEISHTIASQKIFPLLLQDPERDPFDIARENNWIQESDSDAISSLIEQALSKYPDKIEAYKNGQKGLLGLFMGEVMKLSGGKADPKMASKLLREKLEN